jgi:hypothetical protein
VVHVRSSTDDHALVEATLLRVGAEVAAAVPCEIGDVWCTWSPLGVQTVGATVPEGPGIVYVDVWIRGRADAAATTRALEAACRASAEGLGVDLEDVWGTLRMVEPGQVFAGGSPIGD